MLGTLVKFLRFLGLTKKYFFKFKLSLTMDYLDDVVRKCVCSLLASYKSFSILCLLSIIGLDGLRLN